MSLKVLVGILRQIFTRETWYAPNASNCILGESELKKILWLIFTFQCKKIKQFVSTCLPIWCRFSPFSVVKKVYFCTWAIIGRHLFLLKINGVCISSSEYWRILDAIFCFICMWFITCVIFLSGTDINQKVFGRWFLHE